MARANWIDHQKFLSFKEGQWASKASEVLQGEVDAILQAKGQCNVMLTGGTTANELYRSWAKSDLFRKIFNVNFYYGDERCVPQSSIDSNYAMSMATLFADGVPASCRVFPMYRHGDNFEISAARYEEGLPRLIDILILAFGQDGHIASIFPGEQVLYEANRLVVTTCSKNHPQPRITVTPAVIDKAISIFVIAKGETKGDIIKSMSLNSTDFPIIPLALVKRATWLLDDCAYKRIVNYI